MPNGTYIQDYIAKGMWTFAHPTHMWFDKVGVKEPECSAQGSDFNQTNTL